MFKIMVKIKLILLKNQKPKNIVVEFYKLFHIYFYYGF